ncbi:hypothetical protein [Spirulina subsalsa]|uniref:hypothetical protein n=1 Tax=Spirulina subsalsa TaxID=54311 RepID=UPI0002E372CF|nr:hypothetical protein [Spirulina subsalsa]
MLHLPHLIQVVKEEQETDSFLYHHVEFHLTPRSLSQLEQVQQGGYPLHLPPDCHHDLRAYLRSGRGCGGGLTFVTYYGGEGGSEALLRSYLGEDGEMIHQVCDRCLTNPTLALSLNRAHHWLIQQVLQHQQPSPFPPTRRLEAIAWGGAVLIIMVYSVIHLATGHPFSVITLLSLGIMLWGVQRLLIWGLKRFPLFA